jgi:dihydrofolate synthase/folylpolyglutamate synthase
MADVETALVQVSEIVREAPRIVITGSLYLAGAVLAANGTPPR